MLSLYDEEKCMKNLLIILLLTIISISASASDWPKNLGEIRSAALYTIHLETDIENYKLVKFEKTIDNKGILTYKAEVKNDACNRSDYSYVQLYVNGSKVNFTNTFITKSCP